MYAGREILSRGKIIADLEKIKKTRGFFTRIFPFTVLHMQPFQGHTGPQFQTAHVVHIQAGYFPC